MNQCSHHLLNDQATVDSGVHPVEQQVGLALYHQLSRPEVPDSLLFLKSRKPEDDFVHLFSYDTL